MNRVLVFFGEETQSEELTLMLRQAGVQATVARNRASMLTALADPYDAIISELHAFLAIPELTGSRAQRIAVTEREHTGDLAEALGRQIDDYLLRPIRREEVRLALERPTVLRTAATPAPVIVGIDGGLAAPWRVATKAAPFDTGILLAGESGTGKELFARSIHRLSRRREGAFVPVNCAAIPQGLAESLLFGHVKGAFTGAHSSRQGVFAKAHRGTLFLDEVGDFAEEIQVKLLRALQSGEVQPLGSDSSEAADVRVIAASSRDLPAMIAEGRFREDLYYRLAVVPIELPRLCERRGDIGTLVDYFLDRFATQHRDSPVSLSEQARQLLLDAQWPGNVRQLQNAVERLVVLCEQDEIGHQLVKAEIRAASAPAPVGGASLHLGNRSLKQALHAAEAELIRDALAECDGRRADCAKRLSISPRSLLYKLKEHGIQ